MTAFGHLLILMLAAVQLGATLDYKNMTIPLDKKYNLTIFHLRVASGVLSATGEACRTAGQIAVDFVNARPDILPDYHVGLDFNDEFLGINTAARFVQFHAAMQQQTTSYEAPIVIGPGVSTSCKIIAPLLKQFNQVAISTFCTAPSLADHFLYPHLYLSMSTHRTADIAMLKFIRDVGHWNRIAIITNSDYINDYQTAQFLFEKAVEFGFDIPWYFMVPRGDKDTLASLKQSDVRIVVIAMSWDFEVSGVLCEAYHQGMKGARYIFVVMMDALTDPTAVPDELYPGCTKKIIYEQLHQSYFIGSALQPFPEEMGKKSFLGYTWPEFEGMLMSTSRDRAAMTDYIIRYICHDAALKSLLSRHFAEKELNLMNMSLRDFRNSPEIVVKAVNNSILQNSIAGLRTAGNISYNDRGVLENDAFMAVQWTPEDLTQIVGRIDQMAHLSEYNLSSYRHQLVGKLANNWIPPKDQPTLVTIKYNISEGVFVAVLVISILLILLQIGCTFQSLYLALKPNSEHALFYTSKIFGFFGCIGASIAAALFATPDISERIAVARIVFLILSLSVVDPILAIRPCLLVQHQLAMFRSTVTEGTNVISHLVAVPTTVRAAGETVDISLGIQSTSTEGVPVTSRSTEMPPIKPVMHPQYWLSLDRRTIAFSLIFFFVNIIILICWLAINPIRCTVELLDKPFYTEATDTVSEVWVTECMSPNNMLAWMLTLVFLHLLALIGGTFLSYQLGNINADFPEVGYIRGGVTNATTLLLACFLIVVILRDPVVQDITIAFASLALSGLTTMAWFYPTWQASRAVSVDVPM